MKDELTMKTEYKKVFTKLCTPEDLRRKVQALPKGEMKQKKAPLMKKLAIAAAVILVLFFLLLSCYLCNCLIVAKSA